LANIINSAVSAGVLPQINFINSKLEMAPEPSAVNIPSALQGNGKYVWIAGALILGSFFMKSRK